MTSVFVAGRTVSKMTDYYNEETHLEEMKKMKKVVKFGGSSLANADQFKKVPVMRRLQMVQILQSSSSRSKNAIRRS